MPWARNTGDLTFQITPDPGEKLRVSIRFNRKRSSTIYSREF